MAPKKILLIDDDKEILSINKKYLTGEGFHVYATASPSQGIQCARKTKPDCILLDVMMPEMDGFQLCTRIRKFSSAPVIFLTGRGSEDDKIQGLVTGADDYIVKPYSLRELKARIDAILRRTASVPGQSGPNVNLLVFGNLTIDKLAHKACYNGNDLLLTNREYEVLLYLASHPGQEVTFEELGNALFGTYQETDRRIVMVNVSRLRKKMNLDYELENMIETVWSRGYRFIAK